MPLKKRYHFVSGLPRSGSTLLVNVLAQNPNFHVTGTSGIIQSLVNIRNTWDGIMENRVGDHEKSEAAKRRVLRAILESYFEDAEKPVVLDKSRGWPYFLEMAQVILERKPKVIVPVRNLLDVLASFERLYRERAQTGMTTQEQQNPALFRTVQGRAQFLLGPEQLVGYAVGGIREAAYRGWMKSMLFVEYDEFVDDPGHTMKEIYDFLEEETFKHDFDNVQQVVFEDDFLWGWTQNLHKIKPKIERQTTRRNDFIPATICNQIVNDSDAVFWRHLDNIKGKKHRDKEEKE